MNHKPMTQERLDAIQERVEVATAGMWDWEDNGTLVAWDGDDAEPVITCGNTFPEDRKLIAHAPQDLAALLAEVERLRHFESIVSWRYGDTTDGKTRDAMVEKAARTLYLREISWSSEAKWDRLPDPVKRMWRLKAEAVLDAALGTGEGA